MQSEIGSNFWLSPDDMVGKGKMPTPDVFNCTGSDHVWLSTCRSAIELVIRTIEERNPNVKKVACLPSFTCHTVFEPFMKASYKIITLPLNEDLSSNAQDILKTVEESGAGIVLLHRYFGFDTLPDIDSVLPALHEKKVIVIEDCTQSMYSSFSRVEADYFVGSIRKWCGVPDGGFAVCKEGKFSNIPEEYDVSLEEAKRVASEMKYKYLFHNVGVKDDFLAQYQEAEKILDNQSKIYIISPLSEKVQTTLDIRNMVMIRRENYKKLLKNIDMTKGVVPAFSIIDDGIVPLYLPILCKNRRKIQKKLVENAIYAPVVWPKVAYCPQVCENADYIYEHILCIPIDQRYRIDDMGRILDVLNS